MRNTGSAISRLQPRQKRRVQVVGRGGPAKAIRHGMRVAGVVQRAITGIVR